MSLRFKKSNNESSPKSFNYKLPRPDMFFIIQIISNLIILFFITTNMSGLFRGISIIKSKTQNYINGLKRRAIDALNLLTIGRFFHSLRKICLLLFKSSIKFCFNSTATLSS